MTESAIIETDFSCERDGLRIRGRQYLPRSPGANPLPAVIVSHGFTGNYLSEAPYARAIAAQGYAAFTFNFCGGARNGEDIGLISDGRSVDLTPLTQIADLLAVTDYVCGMDTVDARDVTLMGTSQGGFITGLTAAQRPELFARIILIYPALCIPDHARRGRLGGATYSIESVPAELDCGKTVLGEAFHHAVVSMDVYRELAGYRGPVLILHGTEDETVDHSYALRAHLNYQPHQSELRLLRTAGHSFTPEQTSSAIASVLEFLAGRREVFSLRVIPTHRHERLVGEELIDTIEFAGYIESRIFTGTTAAGAHHTEVYARGERVRTDIEYELHGIDADGHACQLHVVNHRTPTGWRPVVTTAHRPLGWLNHAALSAVIEPATDGPTIRFFGPPRGAAG